MTGIEKAVLRAKGVSALARHLGVSRQRVQNWFKQGYVPQTYIIEIEAEFGVPRRELVRPTLREMFE